MTENTGTLPPAENLDDGAVLGIDPSAIDDIEDDGPVDLDADTDGQDDSEPEADHGDDTDDVSADGQEVAFAEIEIDGQIYQVPEPIKDKFMFQQDYTRKTQEVAEMRKSFERKMQDAEAAFNVSQEEMQASAYLMSLQQQLQALQKTDWQTLENEDPMAAQSKWREYQQLRDQAGQVEQYRQQLQTQRQQQTEALTAQRLQETAEYAKKELPNWSPQMDAEITQFAVQELGFDVDTLKSAYNPQIYRALYLAHIGQKAIARGQSIKPKQPGSPAKPLNRVSGKANTTTTRDPADMSMEEYDRWASKKYKD